MKTLKRIYYHSLRFQSEFKYGSIFAVSFMLFFGLFYPKDSIGEMVDVMQSIGLFANLSKISAGWGVWASIMIGIMMYLLIAFVSINIGAKVVPTKDTEGTEFFMGSNPMNPRRFYLENVLAAMFVVLAILIPAYIVILIQTWYFDGMEVIGGITLTIAMFLVIAYFFIAVTSAFSSVLFQSSKAKAVGFGYMIYGFIVEMLSDNENLQDVKNLSVNTYTKLSSLVTATDYDWNPLLVVFLIGLFFNVVGFWRIKYPHYLEEATSRERFSIVDGTIGYVVRPNSRLGRSFPIIAEQLRRDKTAIFVVMLLYILWIPAFWSVLSTAGDRLGELMAGFDTPTTRAIAQGHALDMTLVGFSIMKFFSNHWMFFGLYPMFVAASIPTREVRTNSQDVLYGTRVKPDTLMNHRIIAMVIEITFLFWLAFLLAVGMNQSLGQDFINEFVGTNVLFNFFLLSWIHYTALSIFIAGVAMIPSEVSKGRRWGLIAFVVMLLLNILPHLNESIDFLKYFSILNYYRPIEILYGEMSIGTGLLQSILTLIFCLTFFFLIKKFRYKDSSLY